MVLIVNENCATCQRIVTVQH